MLCEPYCETYSNIYCNIYGCGYKTIHPFIFHYNTAHVSVSNRDEQVTFRGIDISAMMDCIRSQLLSETDWTLTENNH